jgi:hypothetical protein
LVGIHVLSTVFACLFFSSFELVTVYFLSFSFLSRSHAFVPLFDRYRTWIRGAFCTSHRLSGFRELHAVEKVMQAQFSATPDHKILPFPVFGDPACKDKEGEEKATATSRRVDGGRHSQPILSNIKSTCSARVFLRMPVCRRAVDGLGAQPFPPPPDGRGERLEHRFRVLPADAGVGDGLAVFEARLSFGRDFLVA